MRFSLFFAAAGALASGCAGRVVGDEPTDTGAVDATPVTDTSACSPWDVTFTAGGPVCTDEGSGAYWNGSKCVRAGYCKVCKGRDCYRLDYDAYPTCGGLTTTCSPK